MECHIRGWAAYFSVWKKHGNMSPCTAGRENTSYERIVSCVGTQIRREPQSLKATLPHTIVQNVLTTRPWPTSEKNGFTQAVWYHIPRATVSRFWGGTILHWAAYNWHWHYRYYGMSCIVETNALKKKRVVVLIWKTIFSYSSQHLYFQTFSLISWYRYQYIYRKTVSRTQGIDIIPFFSMICVVVTF